MQIAAAEAGRLFATAKDPQLPVGIYTNSGYEAATWTAYSTHSDVSRRQRVHSALGQ